MASFESGLECEDTRVDTDHKAAQDTKAPALYIKQHSNGASPSGNAAPCAKCKNGIKPWCYQTKKCDASNGWRRFAIA